jgi:ATP/maltotriose-dependent transcriptional regulator MalT
LALQDSAVDRRVMDQPLISLGEYWKWVDQHQRARDMLVDLLQRAHDMGDENARPWLLFLLGDAERLLGNLAVALECSRDGRDAAEQSGQHLFALHHLALESLVEAQRGNPEQATDAARHALEHLRDNYGRMVAAESLGHLALLLGAPEDVTTHLEPRLAFVRQENIVEPGAARFAIDLIEALVELGRRDEAAEILDWYEGNALRVDRASARGCCLRSRGLLEARDGKLAAAVAHFEEALTWHAKVDIPLDRARTLLALGAALRRAKRRRDARTTLEEALAEFERIGASLWARRARDELRRISGRAPTAGALTPAEERVAALVAEGKTNAEVAAALFLSDRTVEGHLSRVYGKLGIRHRTELGPALAARQTQGVATPNPRDTPVSADSPAP